MDSILVVFESEFGQTEKIAAFVGGVASRHGIAAEVVRASDAPALEVATHDGIVIVAPVYYGRYPVSIRRFAREFAPILAEKPTAFVSVGNAAASATPAVRDGAVRTAQSFLAEMKIAASLVATAGGALAYPRYGFFRRLMMTLIAYRAGFPKDTSRVHELTDWSSLEQAVEPWLELASAQAEPPGLREVSGIFPRPGALSATGTAR